MENGIAKKFFLSALFFGLGIFLFDLLFLSIGPLWSYLLQGILFGLAMAALKQRKNKS